ncbi:MAG: sulfotransferase family protein [Pseudomonadales bacterium]
MIDIDKLINEAKAKTGLQDFGSDDFLQPLRILIDALENEANFNDVGKFRAELTIQNGLSNRLLIEDYIKQHPEVLQLKIDRPIFIAGLPRTGTTALHHMLNHDPANHTLRLWEGQNPVPPPEKATYLTDPRIAKTQQSVAMTEQFLPGFFKTHLLDAEEPDECHLLFNRNFMSVEYSANYHIPSYANWLYAQDLTASYAYHKRQLQLLQHKKPGRWVLKTPLHQLGVEAILKNHPDAIIVQTHRAPLTFVASGCSFSMVIRQGGSDHIDPLQVGRDWMDMLHIYTTTFEAARAKLEPQHPGQFIDVYHDEFVQNPWPGIEKIYQATGAKLGDEGRASMQRWLDEHPQGKHGKHEYRLEDYGITRAEVEDLFGAYVERYGLTME